MKTLSPQRHRGTEKNEPIRNAFTHARAVSIFSVSLCLLCPLGYGGSGFAVQTTAKPLPGRLFYTPAQRDMLVNARAHKVTEIQKTYTPPESAPMSFDGVITRSDGVATHWINGRPHVGQPSANIRSLKPGQTRTHEKIYEPYQLQRPGEASKLPRPKATPPDPAENEATP